MSTRGQSIGRAGAAALFAAATIVASPAIQAAEAGMRVIKDPVTGQLRAPTHEEVKDMLEQEQRARASLRRAPDAAPKLRRNAHGGISNEVGDKFLSFSVARRNADGSTTVVCVPSEAAADRMVNATQAATAPSAKEHAHDHQ